MEGWQGRGGASKAQILLIVAQLNYRVINNWVVVNYESLPSALDTV